MPAYGRPEQTPDAGRRFAALAGRRWELTATNLFDRDVYAYTLINKPVSATCSYAIRPRNVLFGAILEVLRGRGS